ncbi:MAG: Nramp family divalent metal transporter, partial [Pirellulales bacterium]
PGDSQLRVAGYLMTESQLVRSLGFTVFLLAFVPLIFGGTIYRMLEKIMTVKLVLVLGYLTFMCVFFISPRVGWEVVTGFFRFGNFPDRADTIVVDRHFALSVDDDGVRYVIKGTKERAGTIIGDFRVDGESQMKNPDKALLAKRTQLAARAEAMLVPGEFFVEKHTESGAVLSAVGTVDDGWHARQFRVRTGKGVEHTFDRLDQVPAEYRATLAELVRHEGVEHKSLWRYFRRHGRLPQLDWFTLVAFAAIAGSGGLANTLFSNYARDKGWGMGARVGAIPSAVGGLPIALSHVGEVFPPDEPNLKRWKGWMRHIFRDQTAVWMTASFVGMALPCMLS